MSHTIQITVFLVVISIVLGFVMEELQANGMSSMFGSIPGLEAGLAALVGMIPNCAASVLISSISADCLTAARCLRDCSAEPVPDFLYSFGKILTRRRICVCSQCCMYPA